MRSSNVIRKNPPGRPRIGKDVAAVFPVRLPKEIVKGVKAYAKAKNIKGQGAAIRHMIERVLEMEGLK
jgi:hypothetical protein